MGVTPAYQDGLTLSASSNSVAGSNPTGLNAAFADALSLSQATSQTVVGPLVLSGAISCVSTLTVASTLTLQAGEFSHVTTVASGPYTVLISDRRIVSTATVALSIVLPASPTIGRVLTIKGNASTNTQNITITGSQNIDNIAGATGVVLNQAWASVDLLYSGTQWLIL